MAVLPLLAGLLLLCGPGIAAEKAPGEVAAGPEAALAAYDRGEIGATVRAYNAWRLSRSEWVPLTPETAPAAVWLESRGIPRHAARSALLEPRDAAYLAERIRLRATAAAATRGATTDGERAERLFDLVVREVAPVAPDDLHERPEEILVRGYGACDQSAWALVALAEQVGIPGVIVYLRPTPDAPSPHTLAALRIGPGWRLYDPFGALRPRGVGLADAIRDPARLDAVLPGPGTGCLFTGRDLAAATINVPLHPRGQLTRWALFRGALRLSPIDPVLWTDPAARLRRVREDLSLSGEDDGSGGESPGSGIRIQPHLLGYEIYARESEPVWLHRQEESPSRGPFRKARLLHLRGRFEEALLLLDSPEAVKSTETGNETLLRLLYSGHARQALRQYAQAASAYREIRERVPDSGWADAVLWNEAACHRELGDYQAAANLLRRIAGPRRAAASLLLSGTPETE